MGKSIRDNGKIMFLDRRDYDKRDSTRVPRIQRPMVGPPRAKRVSIHAVRPWKHRKYERDKYEDPNLVESKMKPIEENDRPLIVIRHSEQLRVKGGYGGDYRACIPEGKLPYKPPAIPLESKWDGAADRAYDSQTVRHNEWLASVKPASFPMTKNRLEDWEHFEVTGFALDKNSIILHAHDCNRWIKVSTLLKSQLLLRKCFKFVNMSTAKGVNKIDAKKMLLNIIAVRDMRFSTVEEYWSDEANWIFEEAKRAKREARRKHFDLD